ncbi:hypothetical protein ABIE05_001809 [Kosakonia cowanii]
MPSHCEELSPSQITTSKKIPPQLPLFKMLSCRWIQAGLHLRYWPDFIPFF